MTMLAVFFLSWRVVNSLGGRPSLLDAKKLALARVMPADKQVAIKGICATLVIGRTTLYQRINAPPTRAADHSGA